MTGEQIVRTAEFNPKVCTYWLLGGAAFLAITMVGIPLIPFWFLLGGKFTSRYLSRMECILTDKVLKVNKGWFVRTEKTIPLEKITDMGMTQGPLMRHFGVERLAVETAGQSGPGSLVSLTGIVDAKDFREAVLAQRDLLAAGQTATAARTTSLPDEDPAAILKDIRSSLKRIEQSIVDK